MGLPLSSPKHTRICGKINVCRNMRDLLEEAHSATMRNTRASALYGHLCRNGEKLVVIAWDSWLVKIQKPENHSDQKATWSSKKHCNGCTRMEACDLEGRPVFALNLGSSCSPRSTDEAILYYTLDLEGREGLSGGLTDMLVGLPGYCIVHLFDKGFR